MIPERLSKKRLIHTKSRPNSIPKVNKVLINKDRALGRSGVVERDGEKAIKHTFVTIKESEGTLWILLVSKSIQFRVVHIQTSILGTSVNVYLDDRLLWNSQNILQILLQSNNYQ